MNTFFETYLNNVYGMLLLDALGFGLYFLIISLFYKKTNKEEV